MGLLCGFVSLVTFSAFLDLFLSFVTIRLSSHSSRKLKIIQDVRF